MSRQRDAVDWLLATVLLAGVAAVLYGIVFELAQRNPSLYGGEAASAGFPGGLAGAVAVPVIAIVAALVTVSLIRREQ
jgi:hypothetical protein